MTYGLNVGEPMLVTIWPKRARIEKQSVQRESLGVHDSACGTPVALELLTMMMSGVILAWKGCPCFFFGSMKQSCEGVPSFLATIRCLLDCACSAAFTLRSIACPSYCGVRLSIDICRRSRQRTSEPAELADLPASAVR